MNLQISDELKTALGERLVSQFSWEDALSKLKDDVVQKLKAVLEDPEFKKVSAENQAAYLIKHFLKGFSLISNQCSFFNAAADGNIEELKSWVSQGMDVNSKMSDGSTALHYAAINSQVASIVELLALGADVMAQDNLGKAPPSCVRLGREAKSKLEEAQRIAEEKKSQSATSDSSKWFVRQQGTAPKSPKCRIFTLPFAGGAALDYQSVFGDGLFQSDEGVEILHVELPGRGTRRIEEPVDDLEALVLDLTAAVAPYANDVPYMLFGHSMGSALCVALCQKFAQLNVPLPYGLVVSGRGPPHLPDPDRSLHDLDDEKMYEELKNMGSSLADLSIADGKAFYPLLRCDSKIVNTLLPPTRIPVPIKVLFGDSEKGLVDVPLVERWKELAGDKYDLELFEGGDHFFLLDEVHKPKVGTAIRNVALSYV